MKKFVYDPAAEGHPLDDLASVLRRAAEIAKKKDAPVTLVVGDLAIDMKKDTTVPGGCLLLADAMELCAPEDETFFRATPFEEVEPGALEHHISTTPTISVPLLAVATRTAKLLQAERSGLKDRWKPCLQKAGGAVLLGDRNDVVEEVVRPVIGILEPTWVNGAWLDMTVRRALGESLDFRP